MESVNKLVAKFAKTKNRRIRKIYSKILLVFAGLDLGLDIQMGDNVTFRHGGLGTVIHRDVVIEDNVKIYSNVTVGMAKPWEMSEEKTWGGIRLSQGCIVCTGARILGKEGALIVGKNTIIGANSVLTCSTGDNEVWAGIPAHKLKDIEQM